MDDSDLDRALSLDPRLLHITGVTAALSDSCFAVTQGALTRAGDAGITTSFDVNYRHQLWPSAERASESLLELASRSSLVFVGLDEAQLLWGPPTRVTCTNSFRRLGYSS